MKGVEASPVEAGRAAPNLEACTGCRSPSPVWISAELSPLSPAPPPPFLGINAEGCVLGPPALSPTWFLNSWGVFWAGVFWSGKRLAHAG